MPNQKGSLKDRIRSWNIFLRYKLKLKKEKRRLKKQYQRNIQLKASGKYYSKPKVFYMSILGLFAGLFEKRKNYRKEESIDKQIIALEQKVEKNDVKKEDILTLKVIEKSIGDLSNNKKNSSADTIKYQNKINNIKNKITYKINTGALTKDLANDVVLTKKEETLTNHDEVTISSSEEIKDPYVPILEIKTFNKDLKKYNKEIQQLNSKILNETNYNSLYEYEFSLKQLKIKLNNLLDKYNNLKNMPGFESIKDRVDVKDIDIYELRNDEKKIKQSIVLCEKALESIETKRIELLNAKKVKRKGASSSIKKEAAKEEKKTEKKEEKKEKPNEEILEIMLANKIIQDNIAKEKKQIDKFNRSMSKLSKKRGKHGIFYYSKNIVSSIVGFGLGLFPLALFKNKILGLLTTNIMLNNSLRSVRRILNPEEQISYINLDEQLNTAAYQLNEIAFTCEDSLRQIENIRQTLYSNYGNDIEYQIEFQKYLDDLATIEQKILNEQEMVLSMNTQVEVTRKKTRQKIKVMDGKNN